MSGGLIAALAPVARAWASAVRGPAEDDTHALVRLFREVEQALMPPWHTGPGELPPAWLRAQVRSRADGATCHEPGFRLLRRSPQGAFVGNGEVRLWLEGGRGFLPRGASSGAAVRVELPVCREHARPHVVTVMSRAGAHAERAEVELRLDASPTARVDLVEALLHQALPARVPFRLEVADGSGGPTVPGARLVLGRRGAALLAPWVLRFARAHRAELGPWRSSLARTLAPGVVAWAQVAPGADYVAQRCGALSLALWRATAEGVPWQPEVAAGLVRLGASVERPWGRLPASLA